MAASGDRCSPPVPLSLPRNTAPTGSREAWVPIRTAREYDSTREFDVNLVLQATAGYFQGNVDVAGNLTKTTGSFKIDHPLDPANKYLYHSFVESPDMKNVYDGVATMDTRGETTVQLPNYFEALNRDYRYQLTSIGRFSPVYVAEKVSNNAFKIAGGLPGQEVSWQVTGIRQDAYAAAHPIVPEVDKDSADQGKYLHPQEVAGVPRSSSTAIGWRDPPSLDRPPERDRPERRDGSGIVSVCR